MIAAGIIFSSVYLGICFYLSRGLVNIAKSSGEKTDGEKKTPQKRVSVIVCARNEEKNIAKLLDCLLVQTYPQDLLQFVIADDRSTDKTARIILSYKEKLKNLAFVKISENKSGSSPKKHAFAKAIEQSAGEIIIQTDADSTVPADWVETSVAKFLDEKTAVSQGAVKYRFDEKISPVLKIYQELDFLSHTVVAAAAIGKNLPLNANANNLAFRKTAYESSGGYGKSAKAVGGDDGLLVQNIWKQGANIVFNARSIVETKPEIEWKSILNQRKKWGSETQFYLPKQILILSLIFAFYVFTVFAIFFTLIYARRSFYLIPALFAVKIVGELFFMRRGLSILGEKKLLPHIIWVSPLNLFITLYSVICGTFGKFAWKGEKYRAKTS